MFRSRGSASDMPTWEALREPSDLSVDGNSDLDNIDQIRATPAPDPVSISNRPVSKRKESDWKIESVPKRARHEARNTSKDQKTVGGDSELNETRHKIPPISSKSSSSTTLPQLPSRVAKGGLSPLARPSSDMLTSNSLLQFLKTKTLAPNSKSVAGKASSTSTSSTKRITQSHEGGLESNDVIEISSGASDVPRSELKGKSKATSFQKHKKRKESASRLEVIEILDSDEEHEKHTNQGQAFRVTQSPKPAGKQTEEKSNAETVTTTRVRARTMKTARKTAARPALRPIRKWTDLSDDEDIDIDDIGVAFRLSLSKKDRAKEKSTPKQKRLVLTARKSVAGVPPSLQLALSPSLRSPDSPVIDLTADASDEASAFATKSTSSKQLPTSPAWDVVQPSALLSSASPRAVKSPPPAELPTTPQKNITEPISPIPREQQTLLGSLAALEVSISNVQLAPASPLLPNPPQPDTTVEVSMDPSLPTGPLRKDSSPSILPTERLRRITLSELPPPPEPGPPSVSIPKRSDGIGATASSVSIIAVDARPSPASLHGTLPQTNSPMTDGIVCDKLDQAINNILGRDEVDDTMLDADELGPLVKDGTVSMDDPSSEDDRTWARASESVAQSQRTTKFTRPAFLTMVSSDSGMDASSEPGLGLNSPVSVPSTRHSSRQSLYSNTSEEANVHRKTLHLMPSSRSTSPEVVGVLVKCSTLGGFPAYRFESYRKDPKNFPKVYYASELPSSIQDHINSQPEDVRMLGEIREVFEAMVLENTADDERDAPPIIVQNDVDEEPTPPWEFWYSNKMWHGKGVPDPDVRNLKGCDCRGACNPKNKNCACAQRQCEAMVQGYGKTTEFAYDKTGRLKFPGYPIFECNNTCWCGPECMNRVVQHGRKVQVMVRKTASKGWGVFNGLKKIPRGTFIGIYAGELLTDEEAHRRGLKYNKAGITYLFDLDFHHLKAGESWSNLYTVDAYHAGNFTRFLNHSCDPNCRLYACYINEGDVQKPLLVVFSITDIEPNQEICFNYQGLYPGDEDDEENEMEEDDDGQPKDKIYRKCLCGAKNCRGILFS